MICHIDDCKHFGHGKKVDERWSVQDLGSVYTPSYQAPGRSRSVKGSFERIRETKTDSQSDINVCRSFGWTRTEKITSRFKAMIVWITPYFEDSGIPKAKSNPVSDFIGWKPRNPSSDWSNILTIMNFEHVSPGRLNRAVSDPCYGERTRTGYRALNGNPFHGLI